MSTHQNHAAPVRRISDISPQDVAAHIREANRLRSVAVRAMLSTLGQALRRPFRREPLRRPAVGQGL